MRAARTGTHAQRDEAILSARIRGETLEAIGRRFGISKQRVSQILEDVGPQDLSARVDAARRASQAARVDAHRDRILAAWRTGAEPAAIARDLQVRQAGVTALVATHASAEDRAARRHARRRREHVRMFTDDDLLGALRAAFLHAGRSIDQQEYVAIAQELNLPSRATIVNRLDNWQAAVRAAGFTPKNARRRHYPQRWTEARCLEALRALAVEMGELPSAGRYRALVRERGDLPSPTTVRHRLGEWPVLALRLACERTRRPAAAAIPLQPGGRALAGSQAQTEARDAAAA